MNHKPSQRSLRSDRTLGSRDADKSSAFHSDDGSHHTPQGSESGLSRAVSFRSSDGPDRASSIISKEDLVRTFSGNRRFAHRLLETKAFSMSILSVIISNTILIAVQTNKYSEMTAGWYFAVIDNVFLGIYIFELFLKLYVWRSAFFKTGWNIFDLIIVFTSFTDWIRFFIASLQSVNPKIFRLLRVFRAVRALRALRALRTITFLEHLQTIVDTLLKSIPAMGSIVILLFLVLYTFAIIGKETYGLLLPNRFGTMWYSMFTLFQLITLDDWSLLYEAVRLEDPTIVYYLMIYIILETFVLINLFIAVLLNNLEATQQANAKKKIKAKMERKNRMTAFLKTEDEQEGPETFTNKVDEELESHDIDYYYPDPNIPHRQKQLMAYYFMLLAGSDNACSGYQDMQKIVDSLVDMCESNEKEDGKGGEENGT